MKKLLVVFTTGLLMLASITASVNAADDSKAQNAALYIYSENPPQSATEFAKDQFSHLHSETFIGMMGFTSDDVSNFRLAPGFKMQQWNINSDVIDNQYCYLVICNSKIVAVMKITYYDNRYEFQLEIGGNFAEVLTEIFMKNSTDPIDIVCTQNGFYAIADNEAVLIEKFIGVDEKTALAEQASLCESYHPIRSTQQVVEISNDSALDVTLSTYNHTQTNTVNVVDPLESYITDCE